MGKVRCPVKPILGDQIGVSNNTQVHTSKWTPRVQYARTGAKRSRLVDIVQAAAVLPGDKSLSILMCDKKKAARDKRIENPNNISSVFIYRPSGTKEQPKDMWVRLLKNAKYILARSVQDGSRAQYSVGWRCWMLFAKEMGITDLFLTRHSAEFLKIVSGVEDLFEYGIHPNVFSYQIQVLISFIAYLYGDRQIMHSTVGNYLSGVCYFFKEGNYSIKEFSDPVVLQARTSLQYLYVQKECLLNEKKRLPVTCDMIVHARTAHFPKCYKSNWQHWSFIVGLVVAFVCMMRASELLITAENHYLRGQDVTFGLLISGEEIRIFPEDAWRYSLTGLTNMALTVHSAKNDWEGGGHRLFFERSETNSSAFGFEVVSLCFEFAQEARPAKNDAFMMWKGRQIVSKDFFAQQLKLIATKFGLDASRYSFHSIRIGGATTLAAAGKPDHYIQKMGRWKSLTFLTYIHWAVSGMADALRTLANPLLFTVEHLRRVNPAVHELG